MITVMSKDAVDVDNAPKYIPLEDIVDLIAEKGLTFKDAGKVLGISKQAVWDRCKRHGVEQGKLKKYKKARAEILALLGNNLLDLTTDDIKKMSPYQRIVAGGILYDKERLERGQATSHIGYADLTKSRKDLEAEIITEKAKLGSDYTDIDEE